MNIINAQIQKIHGLLPTHIKSDKELKESIIIEYTQDFTKYSTKDLTFEQANALIVDLGGKPVYNQWAGFNIKNKQHEIILSLLQHAGWQVYSKKYKRYIRDMKRFGNWLQTKAPVKKPLGKMTTKEVSRTIWVFENKVLPHELNKSLR